MSGKDSKHELAAKSGTFTIGGDLTINRLGYGALRLAGERAWGEPRDRREVTQVLHRALDLGINFIDTADAYGPNISESIIAEALYPYPADLVIATKAGFLRPSPTEWIADASPRHLREACIGSLRRLKVDQIDLYQLHGIDPKVPLADQIGALLELQKEGKIRHIGLSNVDVAQAEAARRIAPIVTIQNHYNLIVRESEDVLHYCEREKIGFIPWFPLETGELAAEDSPLSDIAKQLKATPSQVALAWLLKKSSVMLPIPGTSKVKHLEENVDSVLIDLSRSDFEALERI